MSGNSLFREQASRDSIVTASAEKYDLVGFVLPGLSKDRLQMFVLVKGAAANDSAEATPLANQSLYRIRNIAGQTEPVDGHVLHGMPERHETSMESPKQKTACFGAGTKTLVSEL